MKVYIDRQKKKFNIVFNGTVKELLRKLEINSEEVLVVRENTLLTEDRKLFNEDNVKILSVVSGG